MIKILAGLMCLGIVCSQYLQPLSQDLHDYVNSVQQEWIAGDNEYFSDKDISFVKNLLGTRLDKGPQDHTIEKKTFSSYKEMPESFDSREQWPNCESIKEIRDQSNCGSCWAFGAVEAMSDRICIHSGQKLQTRVSSNDLLSCCGLFSGCGMGCNGGWPSGAWSYWKHSGIVSGDLYNDKTYCQAYAFPPCAHHVQSEKYDSCDKSSEYSTPSCTRECTNDQQYDQQKTHGSSAYRVSGEQDIMREIMENGPVEGTITVYGDFPSYKTGVYHHVSGSMLGGHAIKIIGWGVQDGVKYWIVVNSWNETWGDQGIIKIRKGTDEIGIEGSAYAGLPKL